MITIALSVGQTKLATGALDRSGELLFQLDPVNTPSCQEDRHNAIVQQIVEATQQVGSDRVQLVGIAYPEMMEPPARFMENHELLTFAPNPYRDIIEGQLAKKLGRALSVELLHDAAAAALGEVSRHGTVPDCKDCLFIVWGTGVASGVISNGTLYWNDPVIGCMIGEIGLQVIRRTDGAYEYRQSSTLPELTHGEFRLDQWMCGPTLTKRFQRQLEQQQVQADETQVNRAIGAHGGLIQVNSAARSGDSWAISLIESAGREMGSALAPFIHYWLVERGMSFARSVIIGSGVSKLGDGVEREGKNILIMAIREALGEGLAKMNVTEYDADNVVLSSIGYEREFYAFIDASQK